MKLSEASVFTEPRLGVLRGVSFSVVENVWDIQHWWTSSRRVAALKCTPSVSAGRYLTRTGLMDRKSSTWCFVEDSWDQSWAAWRDDFYYNWNVGIRRYLEMKDWWTDSRRVVALNGESSVCERRYLRREILMKGLRTNIYCCTCRFRFYPVPSVKLKMHKYINISINNVCIIRQSGDHFSSMPVWRCMTWRSTDRENFHNTSHAVWHGAHCKQSWKESWTQTIYWYRTGKRFAITFITITFQNTVMKRSSALCTQSTRRAQASEAMFAPGARQFHVQRLFPTCISSSPTSWWTASTCAAPTELPPSRSRRPGPCNILKCGGCRLLRGGGRPARDQATFEDV